MASIANGNRASPCISMKGTKEKGDIKIQEDWEYLKTHSRRSSASVENSYFNVISRITTSIGVFHYLPLAESLC